MNPLTFALLNSVGASPLVHFRLRTLMLRAAGVDLSLRCRVFDNVLIRTKLLHLGNKSTINSGTIIDNRAPVWVGDNVGIAIGVRILTGHHDYADSSVRAGAGKLDPVRIEDGAWIGSGATILPGVVVGAGSVIGAGAVVTKSVGEHGLYLGSPARRVRDLPRGAGGRGTG